MTAPVIEDFDTEIQQHTIPLNKCMECTDM